MSRTLCLLLGGLALAVGAPARAACEAPIPTAELARLLSSADAAFADLDSDSFRASLSQVRQSMPCASEPLTVAQAAAWHRAEAFLAFLDRDHAGAVQHLRAMLAASPGYELSDDIAPEGHPLRTDFEIAQGLGPVERKALPAPAEGSLRVDGQATDSAPGNLPYLLQQLDATGAVRLTSVQEVGASLPAYAQAPAVGAGRRSGPQVETDRRHRLGPPLVATALVAAAASASLYGMSNARVDAFWDPATADQDLDRLRGQANGMATASLCTAVVAVGAGTAAVLSFTW